MRKLFSRSVIVALAFIGFILGIYTVIQSRQKPATAPILFTPAAGPFPHFVAGSGIVESASENIFIGSPFNEVVEFVYAKAGDTVKSGDPLFSLSTVTLKSQWKEAKAKLEIAHANYERLQDFPRSEELSPLEAQVKQSQVLLQNEKEQLASYERVQNPKSISQNEFNVRKYTTQLAEFQLEESVKKLELLKAGTWNRDLAVSQCEMKKAEAELKLIETAIERSTIRAPFDGDVLQVNVRPGEFASADRKDSSLILFGVSNPVHIRIDIDEDDAWRIYKDAPGRAYVRGNNALFTPIEFVRIEPYIVPKRSLTGDNNERVDTRVLQVIYRFNKENLPIYFGQLMDVFIEAKANPQGDLNSISARESL